ncbi:ATP-binding protein [Kineosporia mesophila]|nr:sensor histidine kinase [Kineosporia mesophila]MCD5354711.1 sensor histidine kinase [Kineosporia mesophila]
MVATKQLGPRTPRPARLPFTRQLLLLQVLLLVVVTGLGFTVAAWQVNHTLRQRFTDRALFVAETFATEPSLADDVLARRQPAVQERARQAQRATGALFVVVTDRDGIRLAHPNPAEIGHRVSTSPDAALRGHHVTNIERGTLGLSARGKVPLRAGDGTIVGEVSVGFDAQEITRALQRLLRDSILLLGLGLLAGIGGNLLLTRLLKRRIFGLEPADLAELVREREAVLFGVSDAVTAIDVEGTVTMLNAEAQRLLGSRVRIGERLEDSDLPLAVRRAMTAAAPGRDVATLDDRALVVTRRDVHHDGRTLGSVVTMVDRTEMENLTSELEGVRLMTQALRAQRHEFANRMHTVRGLLHTAGPADALEYLDALAEGPGVAVGMTEEMIAPASIRAFLAGKTAEASETGVALVLSETSYVPRKLTAPVEVITVLGNLVNNAVEAARRARQTRHRPARVEVDLLVDGEDLLISVADSGDGVPETMRRSIFQEGFSTRGPERGLGLPNARRTAESFGGSVDLTHPGGVSDPTVFVARMPGVLRPAVTDATAPGHLVHHSGETR